MGVSGGGMAAELEVDLETYREYEEQGAKIFRSARAVPPFHRNSAWILTEISHHGKPARPWTPTPFAAGAEARRSTAIPG
jgi:hypothetical protein